MQQVNPSDLIQYWNAFPQVPMLFNLQLETLSLASGALCSEILLKGEAIVQDLGFLVSQGSAASSTAATTTATIQ
jgi:hypothetical protein